MKIRNSTLEKIERVKEAIAAEAEKKVRVGLGRVARELLDKFQAKVKTPVRLVECNGEFWLVDKNNDSERYKELCGVLDDVANPLQPGSFECRGMPYEKCRQERYMKAFPELIELWWIAYECDAMPCRPGLGIITPSVKPRIWKRK